MVALCPRVEALARELCAAEGWDPNELIELDADHGLDAVEACARACDRWRLYAGAAARLVQRQDAWDTF